MMKLIKKVNYLENIKHEGNNDILFIVYNDLVFIRKLKSCKILKSNFLQTFFIITGIDNKHIELFFIFNSFVKFVTERVKKFFYFLNFKNSSIIKK
ncbi:hypothetical protein [Guillardia theta]|uniref:Uncharacterized protein n=1 Tax=Guillardia theta TaxID=55529 RepID=Q9AVX1_GUITH|nr:hypothetical protein GTHECHR2182 [Guillardia theta]CAC27100.1 hypothetical protein [Guillardia theta]